MNHLYRSRRDRMLAGVAGGIAEGLDLDPSLVRIGWVVLTFASGGLALLLYIVMAIVVPDAPEASAEAPFGAASTDPSGTDRSPGAAGSSVAQAFTPTTETSWADSPPADGTPQVNATPPPISRPGRDERRTALVLGGILVAAGLLLLLQRLVPVLDPGVVWPIVLVAVGLLLLAGSFRRR